MGFSSLNVYPTSSGDLDDLVPPGGSGPTPKRSTVSLIPAMSYKQLGEYLIQLSELFPEKNPEWQRATETSFVKGPRDAITTCGHTFINGEDYFNSFASHLRRPEILEFHNVRFEEGRLTASVEVNKHKLIRSLTTTLFGLHSIPGDWRVREEYGERRGGNDGRCRAIGSALACFGIQIDAQGRLDTPRHVRPVKDFIEDVELPLPDSLFKTG